MKKVLFLIIILTSVFFVFSNKAYADTNPIKDGTYYIYSALNDKFAIDLTGGVVKKSNNIQLYSSNQSVAQQWKVTYIGDGYYKIASAKDDNYVLDVYGAHTEKGTNVQLFIDNNSDAQRWTIKDVGKGYYSLIPKNSNCLLDVKSGKAKNSANIHIWTSNNSKAQKFIFVPVVTSSKTIDNGTYMISSVLKYNFSIDLTGGKVSNGTNIQLYHYGETKNQLWYIERLSNGFYKIASSKNHNYVLDVKSGGKLKGTNIQLYKYTGSTNQQFAINKNEDGSYTFINRTNALAIDVYNANTSNKTNLWTYTPNNSKAQKFNIIKQSDIFPDSNQVTLNSINTEAKKLMIVAHPDDETLWGSHALYRDKYLVVCVTCGVRHDRVIEFKEVMSFAKDDYMMLGFPDLVNGKKSDWKNELGEINKQLKKIIDSKDWEIIVTHNPEGEYGHIHHKMLSQVVTTHADYSILYYFGRFYTNYIPNEDKLYKLTDEEFKFKTETLIPLYETQKGAIDNLKNMVHYESWVSHDDWYVI